jgi:hypothetical protein
MNAMRNTRGVLYHGCARAHLQSSHACCAFFIRTSGSATDAGAAKPDPAPFLLAIDLCGCTPEEIVHVGDDFQCDVLGKCCIAATLPEMC